MAEKNADVEDVEGLEAPEEESKETEENQDDSEDSEDSEEKKEEYQEQKYPYPGLKLMDTMKIALDKLEKKEYGAVANLLKSVVSKYPQYPKLKEPKDVQHARDLLREAAETLKANETEISKLSEELGKLREVEKRFNSKLQAEKDELVDGLVSKKLSLNLISDEEKSTEKEIHSKLPAEDLKRMFKSLEGKKPLEAKKEALKGEETETKHQLSDKITTALRDAGIREETINELNGVR